jgi:hypothetical protein
MKRQAAGLPYPKSNCDKCGSLIRSGWRCAEEIEATEIVIAHSGAEHILKTLPDYWEAIERGDKTFEVRRDDRGFQKGDTLRLQKLARPASYDIVQMPHRLEMDGFGAGAKPKELRRRVTYILTGGQLGIEPGYVVMGLDAAP